MRMSRKVFLSGIAVISLVVGIFAAPFHDAAEVVLKAISASPDCMGLCEQDPIPAYAEDEK